MLSYGIMTGGVSGMFGTDIMFLKLLWRFQP